MLPCSRCAAQLHPQARRGEPVLCTRTMQWVPLPTVIGRVTASPTSPGCGERKPCNACKKFLVAMNKIMQIFRQMLTYLKPEKQIAYSTPNRRRLLCSLLATQKALLRTSQRCTSNVAESATPLPACLHSPFGSCHLYESCHSKK